MIFHVASIAAFFVDQLAQTPVVVQCVVPPDTDPELKQWVQPILNLVSIVAVVGIAIFSFGATSRKEHRRWVLDQKKAEWKELFSAITEIQKEFPPIYETESLIIGKEEKMAEELANKWKEIEYRIDVVAMMPFIFIAQKLIDIKFYEDWKDFKEKASDSVCMPKLIKNRTLKQLYTSMKDSQTGANYRDPQSVYCGIVDECKRIVVKMRSDAETDLNIQIRRPFGG